MDIFNLIIKINKMKKIALLFFLFTVLMACSEKGKSEKENSVKVTTQSQYQDQYENNNNSQPDSVVHNIEQLTEDINESSDKLEKLIGNLK